MKGETLIIGILTSFCFLQPARNERFQKDLLFCQIKPALVEGKNFTGYIFQKEYKSKYFGRNVDKAFTPQIDDILKLERLLIEKAHKVKSGKISTKNKCWNYGTIKKYNRQYFGTSDEQGNKAIIVNFVLKQSTPKYWTADIVIVLEESCKNVWTDTINI